MKEIASEQVKQIQLDVLTAIHQFCIENNIRYSISSGTLLGAIRHKGYIPWDDDIDIYLLREDYNKLMAVFPETYQGLYKIVSLERDGKWDRAFAKAYHCRTVFKEATTSDYSLGVCIDIFPIDAVPDDNNKRRMFNAVRKFFQGLYTLKFIVYSKKRSFFRNIVLFWGKMMLLPFSLRVLSIYVSKWAQQCNGLGYLYVYDNVNGVKSNPFKKELFGSLAEISFENRVYMAFANADSYLKSTYGDYMKLPPEEKRVTHHIYRAYWKE